MEVKQISTALGAEITNVDLAKVSDDQVEEIKSLLTEHKVIFFPPRRDGVERKRETRRE